MKTITIIFFLLFVCKVQAQDEKQQVFKFRTVKTYTAVWNSYAKKWSELEESDVKAGTLIVRDIKSRTICFYGSSTMKLSVVNVETDKDPDNPIGYNCYKLKCIDDENKEVSVMMHYAKDSDKDYSIMYIISGDSLFKVYIDKE